MAIFQSKSFSREIYGSKYRRLVNKHPFLLFGLPFISIMVAGSFFLTPATALRYEKHDKKVKHVSQEEALNVGKNKRKVDMKEEYYVGSALKPLDSMILLTST
jgi:cytochrome c oxidase assembly protein subunit 16